ncbi:MAG TPA: EamA family transporter [Alphaproteobacteria bacterium]|nr:EamA family transporter [Alphaproteobacteria bacterium]
MPLQLSAAGLVLLAAIMHASWNALVKRSGDRLLVMAFVSFWPIPPALAAALFLEPRPAPSSWPFIAGSVIIHVGYYIGLIKAYRYGDLSLVYPLARGTAPVMVAALSALTAGELLSPMAVAGITLVSLGTASLAFESGRPRGDRRHSVLFALFTALTITGYTVVDGFGVRRSGAPLGYIAWLFAIEGLPIFVAALIRRRGEVLPYLRASWHIGMIGGFLSCAGYGIAIWAMSLGAMGQVAALRETGVIFAAIIGALFLREPFGLRRILAAVVVAIGIVILQLGS